MLSLVHDLYSTQSLFLSISLCLSLSHTHTNTHTHDIMVQNYFTFPYIYHIEQVQCVKQHAINLLMGTFPSVVPLEIIHSKIIGQVKNKNQSFLSDEQHFWLLLRKENPSCLCTFRLRSFCVIFHVGKKRVEVIQFSHQRRVRTGKVLLPTSTGGWELQCQGNP